MIDYLFRFADEATARANVFVLAQKFFHQGLGGDDASAWITDHVLPNVQAWRPSQDTTAPGLQGTTIVLHSYLPGWFCIVATNNPVQVLLNAAALQFALYRDAANA